MLLPMTMLEVHSVNAGCSKLMDSKPEISLPSILLVLMGAPHSTVPGSFFVDRQCPLTLELLNFCGIRRAVVCNLCFGQKKVYASVGGTFYQNWALSLILNGFPIQLTKGKR